MIKIENLKKRFGKLQVLKGIDLELPGKQAVAIIGPNGSGKTTMIKSILGQVLPDEGNIFINGEKVSRHWDYRRNIGYMSQISRFPENMKIRELFSMVKDIRDDVKTYDEELLHTYQLEKMYQKALGTLSGGTKQKVSAALAFLFDPQILILDEPTAGLDPIATEQIKAKIFKEKEKGKLIIITSHIMSDIEELADTIVFIIEGNIQFVMPMDELKEKTGEKTFSKAMAKVMEEYNYA